MITETEQARAIVAHGKFFAEGTEKFFLKAMRLAEIGTALDFDQKLRVLTRLKELRQAHTTALILTAAQSNWILELASQSGLSSIVELDIDTDELIDHRRMRAVAARISRTVNDLNGRPGLFGFLVNCAVSQDALRAYGLERARSGLRALVALIRNRNPRALIGLRHRAGTRALALLEEDFIYCDVPTLEPVELRDFVVSLHHIAEARPLIIELSQTSPGQDEAIAVAFGAGVAGVVAPAMPIPASEDWLGARLLRASELMPFVTLNGTCPPAVSDAPMVSVVICAYNAERTMRQCLESLRKLDYPNYEVVIVDDGSRDRTADISMDFPEFRLIRQPNKGLSVARNVGLHAARGDVVAYTDSDCVVDPHWLALMIRTMREKDFDGCGGPNYAPHEDGWIEAGCAASPGAPCHVLTADDVAEHLAGCNMVYSKAALLKVDGFDPQFTAAGDDVDACWRMLDAGLQLGFCPAAFVWHFRRNTIKAYYGQQRGYGRAEAMLYARYPERFNILGQIKWRGMIPGLLRTVPGGKKRLIFWGTREHANSTVFDPALSLFRFLPQTLEWTIGWGLVALAAIALGITAIPALSMLALGPIWALYYAWHAPIERCHVSLKARMLVTYLAYVGPIVRAVTRYKTLNNAQRELSVEGIARQRPAINWFRRTIRLAYWNETWSPRDVLLDRLNQLLAKSRCPAIIEPGWKDYDLEIRPTPFTRVQLKTADEEHEQGKLKNHIAARIRLSNLGRAVLTIGALGAIGTAALSMVTLAIGLGALTLVFGVCAIAAMVASGRLVYRAVEECALELNLFPLGQRVRTRRPASRPQTAAAPAETLAAAELTAQNNPAAE